MKCKSWKIAGIAGLLILTAIISSCISLDGTGTTYLTTNELPMDIYFGQTALDVVIEPPYAYVANGMGIAIMDISDPVKAGFVSSISDSPNGAACVVKIGNTLFTKSGWGVRAMDISNPLHPQLLDRQSVFNSLVSIDVEGNVLAGVSDNSSRLYIMDVSDPSDIQILADVSVDWYPVKVDIQGTIAWIANDVDVVAYDISDPSNPQHVGQIMSDAQDLAFRGNYGYFPTGRDGVDIVDVSDPASPVRVNTLEYPSVDRIAINGDHMYTAYQGWDNVYLYDISSATEPTSLGSVYAPTYDQENISGPSFMSATNTHLIRCGQVSGLHLLDVQDPENAFVVTSAGGEGRDIVMDGDRAFVAMNNAGILVLKMEDATTPSFIRTIQTGDYVQNLQLSGSRLYFSGENGFGFMDCTAPESVTNWVNVPKDNACSMLAVGNYVYTGSPNFTVWDVSSPESVTSIMSIPDNDWHGAMTVYGDILYAPTTAGGMDIIDLGDPATPVILKTICNEGDAPGNRGVACALQGHYLYLSTQAELIVLDVTDPKNPVETSRQEAVAPANIVPDGNRLIMVIYSDSMSQILEYSLANPASPVLENTLYTMCVPTNMVLTTEYAYCASDKQGFNIIQRDGVW